MTWDRDFRAGTIQPAPGTGTLIKGIKNWSAQQDNEVRQEIASNSTFPQAVYLASRRPMATFTTEDLIGSAAYLPFGACITVGTGGLVLWSQKQDCSGIASTGHVKYTVNNGVLVPRQLSVSHQGVVQLSWEIFARYDGVNSPITRTTGSLPANATLYGRFEMYSAQIGGVSLEGKRSIQIDFNPAVVTESADNTVPPTVVSVSSFSPRITIQGVDPDWFASIPEGGLTCSTGNTVLFFKDKTQAIAVAAHVRVRAAGLATLQTIGDHSNTGPAQTTLVLDCGTTATDTSPITIQTAVAIT